MGMVVYAALRLRACGMGMVLAMALSDKYRDPSGERVFCFHRIFASVSTFSGSINGFSKEGKKTTLYRGLKKIGMLLGIEDLEFYAASCAGQQRQCLMRRSKYISLHRISQPPAIAADPLSNDL
jgi:hypothetical protein